MASAKQETANRDWWYRENQRRQVRVLIFLLLLLVLIGFFYMRSNYGRHGTVGVFDFDTANHIAFIHRDEKGNTHIYTMRADGSDRRPLTAPGDHSNKQDPAWTTDGKSLLYASNKVDARVTQIYILGGGETMQVTFGPSNKFAPVASPDGKRVAYVTQGAIKTLLLNGNEPLQVLPPPRAGNAPTSDDPNALAQNMEPQGPLLNAAFSVDGKGIAGVQSLSVEDNPVTFGDLVPGDQVARAVPPGGERALILNNGHHYAA